MSFLKQIINEAKPEADYDNHYFRYFSFDFFSWSNLVYKINLSNFDQKTIDSKVTSQEYEQVLNHVRQTTRRLRRIAELILYAWLIIAFSPFTSLLKETEIPLLVVLSYASKSLIILLPVLFYLVVYGQDENLALRTQLALNELNDREYNHKGMNWSLTEDGKYMHLQMNFAHYRQKRVNQTPSTSVQDSRTTKKKEIEVRERYNDSIATPLFLV